VLVGYGIPFGFWARTAELTRSTYSYSPLSILFLYWRPGLKSPSPFSFCILERDIFELDGCKGFLTPPVIDPG